MVSHSPIEIVVRGESFLFPATFEDLPDGVFADLLLDGDRKQLPQLQAQRVDEYLADEGLTHGQMLALIRFLHAIVDNPDRWDHITTTDGPDKPGIIGLAKIGRDIIRTWRERDPLP